MVAPAAYVPMPGGSALLITISGRPFVSTQVNTAYCRFDSYLDYSSLRWNVVMEMWEKEPLKVPRPEQPIFRRHVSYDHRPLTLKVYCRHEPAQTYSDYAILVHHESIS